MNMTSVKCNQCGIDFLKEISQINAMKKRGWNNHFCNVKCLSEFGNISRTIEKNKRIEEYYKNPKKCLNCNSIIDYKDKSIKKYCSQKCSAIHTQKNGGHCKWNNIERQRLRELARKNPKFSGWNKGLHYAPTKILKCRQCQSEFTQVISKMISNKTQTCSKECRCKIQSLNLSSQYKNGKKVYGGTTKWLNYKNIKVQGSFEYRTCIILYKWKELNKIKNWEYTKDRFEYIGIDNKKHNYLMDFKVWNNDNTFYYIETKGFEKENDKLKWKAVRDKGHQLEIWFKKDIEKQEGI